MPPENIESLAIAEAAAVHLMATLPNFLILEHMADDVPWQRSSTLYGFRELIERLWRARTGRAGGLLQMKKVIMMAPPMGRWPRRRRCI